MKTVKLPEEFIQEFDHKKNKIKFETIKRYDSRKIWWVCKKKHSWQVSAHSRNRYSKINNEKYISGCPKCYEEKRGQISNRAVTLPKQFVDEFDHKKNTIKLENIRKTSNIKIWWLCKNGHSWKTSPTARNRYTGRSKKDSSKISICPTCQRISSYKINKETLKYFNQKLNPGINLNLLDQRSDVKIKWQCPTNKKHIWVSRYKSRASKSNLSGCPFCSGNLVEEEKLLINLYPKIYKSIIKDKKIDYKSLPSGTAKKLKFKCEKGADHIFERSVESQTHYNRNLTLEEIKKNDFLKCPFCLNRKFSKTNTLFSTHPYLAKIFDEKKNGVKTSNINFNSRKNFWWHCKTGKHSFFAKTANVMRSFHSKSRGCNICSGRVFTEENSLKNNYPKLFAEVDRKNNNIEDINSLRFNSAKKINWVCSKNKLHKWISPINQRVSYPKCPFCINYKFHSSNSLAKKLPKIAELWDFDRNKKITPEQVKYTDSLKLYFWKCKKDDNHIWKETISRMSKFSDCPMCSDNFKWNKKTLRTFLYSIRNHLNSLTPAEKYLIFQQTGLPDYRTSTRNFIKNFASGNFPKEEIEKFIEGKKSIVDDFIQDKNLKIDGSKYDDLVNDTINNLQDQKSNFEETNNFQPEQSDLPIVETKNVLKTLSYLVRNVNQEAIEFLIASAKHKIWKDVFRNEKQAILDLKKYNKDEYVKRVQFEFLNEYKKAKALKLPKGYSFEHKPNLMQKLTAAKVIQDRRVGNWSGTGAGKTLSAVLASRYIGAKNVVVCCPNALAQRMDTGWAHEIVSIFPDSNVRLKSFDPLPTKTNNFYVLNFEAFQQKDSSKKIVEFLKKVKVDFVIIDEIHYSKQRQVENLSERKKNITSMLAEIQKKNKKLHVLGMSATPVINNLYEGRSLVEMITGEVHKDLPTQININNCMKLHQKLATVGLRWMPDYKMKLKTTIEDIDCSHITDDVKELGKHPTPLDLEKLLTREKMQIIKKHIEPKTIIYTHYLDDIADYIKKELEKDGLRVGMFTGEDKSGLEEFKNGSLDVLIGSRTVGTGVNGLQNICRKIIINSLPWTNAEYEQLIGRVYRQGQKRDVEIVIPLTEGTVNGQQWSWCKSRYDRIKFKKTVGDAAVDGVIPSEEIRTESQVLQDLMKWIERISGDDDFEIKREPIKSEFVFDSSDEKKRIAKYGDFSKMNREWNNSKSITTHEKIKKNPDLWKHYHQMFEENKKKWTVVPTTELVKFFKSKEGYEIGDFGCGKAILHEQLSNKHTIHSFDHYACNQYVTACDISKTTLNDKQLDFAVFSLSMMGSNIADYIIEANRTLKLDGRLFIIEATSRFKDLDQFKRQLIQFGFDYLSIKEIGKFTQIKADKVKDINLKNNLELKF